MGSFPGFLWVTEILLFMGLRGDRACHELSDWPGSVVPPPPICPHTTHFSPEQACGFVLASSFCLGKAKDNGAPVAEGSWPLLHPPHLGPPPVAQGWPLALPLLSLLFVHTWTQVSVSPSQPPPPQSLQNPLQAPAGPHLPWASL